MKISSAIYAASLSTAASSKPVPRSAGVNMAAMGTSYNNGLAMCAAYRAERENPGSVAGGSSRTPSFKDFLPAAKEDSIFQLIQMGYEEALAYIEEMDNPAGAAYPLRVLYQKACLDKTLTPNIQQQLLAAMEEMYVDFNDPADFGERLAYLNEIKAMADHTDNYTGVIKAVLNGNMNKAERLRQEFYLDLYEELYEDTDAELIKALREELRKQEELEYLIRGTEMEEGSILKKFTVTDQLMELFKNMR